MHSQNSPDSPKANENLTSKSRKNLINYKEMSNTELVSSINSDLYRKAKNKLEAMNSKDKNNLETSISWFFLPDNLKKLAREKIQEKMKIIDIISLILGLIGILTNIIASSIYISFKKIITGTTIEVLVIGEETSTVRFLRWITSISTLLLIFFIIYHYKTRLQFQIFKQKYEINSTIFSTKLIFLLVAEIIICAVHTPPYCDNVTVPIRTSGESTYTVQVDLDLILSMMIPLRVYLLFRYYSFYSPWADDKAEKVCHDCNTMGGISFAIKAEIKERPYFVVGVLMILSIVIFGYGLRNVEVAFIQNVEVELFQDWTFIWNGFWCIIITILTVGYGDYYPATHLGRTISVVACLWGTFLISLMVVSLTVSVEFTPQEEKAYEDLKNHDSNFQLKKKGMKLIILGQQLSMYKRLIDRNPEQKEGENNVKETKDPKALMEYNKLIAEIKITLDEFRNIRKKIISKEHEVSADTILHKLNKNINDQMEQMIQVSNFYVSSLIDYIKLAKDVQVQITECSNRLEELTRGLYNCIEDTNNYSDDKIKIN